MPATTGAPSGMLAVALVALTTLRDGLRLAASVGRERAADVIRLGEPARARAPDIAFVRPRVDELALRCAPEINNAVSMDATLDLGLRRGVRNLLSAVLAHERIDLINPDDHGSLDRFKPLIETLIEQRNKLGISDLLRFAIDSTSYRTVIAAAFDGAQRLANIDKLFDLAERFEAPRSRGRLLHISVSGPVRH